ncbi:MAG: AAA family ATPase [Actinomycetota bacterium]
MTEPIGHPYQLRRVELQDFKSVAHADVELRPLTVVVGANSSGKSTLLQSILAVTQAVRSRTASAEFPLNGEFVRLGTFDETRNFRSARPDGQMEVAFRLADWRSYRNQLAHGVARGGDGPTLGVVEFGWRAYLGDSPEVGEARGGFAQIESLQIEIESVEPRSDERTTVLTCDVSDLAADADVVDAVEYLGQRGRFPMRGGAPIAASGRVQDWTSGLSGPIDAVVLAGGVPQALMRSVKKLDQIAEVWWTTAETLLEEEIENEKRIAAEAVEANKKPRVSRTAVKRALADVEALNLSVGGDAAAPRPPIGRGMEGLGDLLDRRWYRELGQLNKKQRVSIAKSMVQLGEARFRKDLRKQLKDEEWIDDAVLVEHSGSAGEALWRVGNVTQRFFSDGVRYLGPLREAPHVLYDPGPSKLDLGVRGEYSAAVLHAQARTWVVMPTDGDGERRRLSDALDHWLREFELAENARSEDRGRMGIGLSVTPPGLDREVDLTAVGVGVSQILPVILLCLLAAPGTLVVLEQPELHLHPRLEQKLADFLLACARSGRQLVIETHSEHLVNRLRYRIASDPTDATHDLIRLVFAESRDGVTSYREPEINQYGGIGDDWPAGFLDLGAREAQDLVRESLTKRKRDKASEIG